MLSKEQKREKIAARLGEAIMLRDSLARDGLAAASYDADTLIKGLRDDMREFEFGRMTLDDNPVVYIGRTG